MRILFLSFVCVVIFFALYTLSYSSIPPHPRVEQMIRDGKIPVPYHLINRADAMKRGINSYTPIQSKGFKPYRQSSLQTTTTFKAIAILIQFSDNPSQVASVFFDSLLYAVSSNSLRDYYQEVSYGTLDVVTVNFPSSLGWMSAPQAYSYYVAGNNGFGTYPQNAQKLTEDAVAAANSVVDFSQYDNNSDGYVDALFIIHAGQGAEYTGNPNHIWSHKWQTSTPQLVDGVYAYVYSMEPEYWAIPGDMTCGVYAHEAGHSIFGIPDLYDYGYDSRGLGRWSLMAGGSWNGPSNLGESPAHPDAWSRYAMGFVTPINIISNSTNVNIPAVKDSAKIFKLWTNGSGSTEYFLVENRQKIGYDTYLRGDGLCIYHVDETQSGNNDQWYPGYTDYGHYKVAIEQADGLWDLEKYINSGDTGDPYPGSTNNTAFNSASTPSSKDYNFNNTSVAVTNISNSGMTMTANFSVEVLPPEIGVTPDSLFADLYTGDEITQTLTINNTGAGELSFNIVTEDITLALNKLFTKTDISFVHDGLYKLSGDRQKDDEVARKNIATPIFGQFSSEAERKFQTLSQMNFLIFHDDFENGMGNWTTQVYSSADLWHITQYNYNSSTHSLWCGIEGQWNYNNGQRINNAAISPTIDLRGRTFATLEFYESYETEPGYDYCMVDVSTDGGSTWIPLRGSYGSAPSGTSGGWMLRSYDLTSFTGYVIKVRYYFDTGDAIAQQYPGWFVDDVNIYSSIDWLTVTPSSGVVPPGSSINIDLTFSAIEKDGGEYNANIFILNNDPDEDTVRVPAHMRVTGAPNIALSDTSIDFGTAFISTTHRDTLTVSNVGTDILNVSNITIDNSDYGVSATNFSLNPGERQNVAVTFTPSVVGERLGKLTITSDDPDEGTLEVDLVGVGIEPPNIVVIPTSLDTNLYTGEQATKILTIENNGASDLTFEISVQEVAVELKVITKTEIAGKSINYQNGGKEDHQWIKNEKIINPYGDIKKENISDYLSSNTETKFNTLISRTNTSSGERLFGALSSQISEIDLTTGGVISSFPTPVPTSDGPTALAFSGVRLYFTDAFNTSKIFVLDPSIGTVLDSFPAPSMSIDGLAFVNGKLYAMDYTAYKIYELNPDGGMVLRIISPPVYIGGGIDGGDGRLFASNFSSGIFELSLVDGSVINSFIPVSDVYGLAFTGRKLFTSVPGIGIDEYDPNTGTYLGRMSSLGFAALAGGSSWLLVNPSTGTISSGSSIDITVVFDATGMNGGDYNANVLIKNNDPDPDQDTVIVPAHLHVTGAPDIALSDTSIDYDTVFIGVVKRETLRVSNVGTDVLNVGNITSDNSDYGVSATNFSLNPGEHQNVAVTFTPSVVGERLGKLTITSDDPDEGTLEVDLVGVGIEPPNIVVTPTSLNSDLLTGEIETKTLTISNTAQAGSSDLHFNVALQMDGTLSADKLFVSKKDVTVPLGTRSGEIPPGTEYHPNQVIVKFKRGVQTAQAMTIRSEIDATVEKKFKMIGAELWNVSGVSVTDVISRYRGNPLIEYVEPNYVVRAIDKIPNDPYFSSLWGMQKIQAPAAWDKTTGNDVLIGVIDTGVDPDHVDLAANIWTNPGEIAGNGIDDDGNGYIDDIHGWDFYNNDNNPYDDNGHGTHVSGTIAASGNNGIGVVGVCWSAKIMGLKFLSSGGSGYTSGAISALEYATMMNVRLTSNSWGGGGYEQALYDAIQAAGAAGDLFIAAAGNSSLNNDSYPHYPSSYVLDNVISVASTTSDDQMSWFSNYGLVSVDLGAPGSDIYSTLPGNNYGSYSGTSMATPHVSGVAGLILSLNSNLGWADVKGILMSTVDPISALAGKCVTGGRLNANNAVQSVQTWLSVNPMSGTVAAGNSVELQVTFDATGLNGGDYVGNILVLNNDPTPDEDTISVSALLHVTGAPDIALSDTSIDFGTAFISITHRDTLTVSNVGTDVLNVSNITSDNSDYGVSVTNFSLNPGEHQNVAVTFTPSVVGERLGKLTITSDDPDEGTLEVNLIGVGVEPPNIVVTPTSLDTSLYTGEQATKILTIENNGASNLTFDVSVKGVSGLTSMNYIPNESLKSTKVLAIGKPIPMDKLKDMPKVMSVNSNDLIDKGKSFQHNPSTANPSESIMGVEIFGSMENIYYAGPRTRGNLFSCMTSTKLIEHRFYLNPSASTQLWFLVYEGNTQVGTYNLISASNVTPAGPGEGWYSSGMVEVSLEAGKYYLIVASFEQVSNYYNQQNIIPYPISTSFGQLTAGAGWGWAPSTSFPPANSQDVPSGAFSGPVAYYQAIVTGVGTSWLSVNPTSGVVPPSTSMNIEVTFDATGMNGGDYYADILIKNNDPDPDQDTVIVPAHLHVTGAPDMALSDTTFDYGTLFIGASKQETLRVSNAGTDVLNVSNIASNNSDYNISATNFSLNPGEHQNVVVTFTPSVVGERLGTLTITSDDPDEGTLEVDLVGVGIEPPNIVVSPASLDTSLNTGHQTTKILTIENNGASNLYFNISLASTSGSLASTQINIYTLPPIKIDASKNIDLDKSINNNSVFPNPDLHTRNITAELKDLTGKFIGITNLYYYYVISNDLQNRGALIREIVFPISQTTLDSMDVLFIDDAIYYATPSDISNIRNWVQEGNALIIQGDDYSSMSNINTLLPGTGIQETSLNNYYSAILTNILPHEITKYVDTINADSYGSYCTIISPAQTIVYDDYGRTHVAFSNLGLGKVAAVGNEFCSDWNLTVGDTRLFANQMVDWSVGGSDFLSVVPDSGTISPGNLSNVSITFDATGMNGGDYYADILIKNNDPDPDQDTVIVPAHLHVTGTPEFSLLPTSLSYGSVNFGTGKVDSVVVTNIGSSQLDITSVVSDNEQFTVTPTSAILAPSVPTKFYITFTPSNNGTIIGNIIFSHNALGTPDTVVVSGNGIGPVFVVSKNVVDFGSVLLGYVKKDSVRVSNLGLTSLSISSVTCNNSQVTILPENSVISPWSSRWFVITFTSTSMGELSGAIIFTHNAPSSPDTATVAGRAVQSIQISVVNRWNIVSVPISGTDPRKNILFPMAISPAYKYKEKYISSDSMFHGSGYWLKFDSSYRIQFNGFILADDTIDVVSGWNMIGSISTPIDVSNVIPHETNIMSPLFGYHNGYDMTDSLHPGSAYWVKMSDPGKLVLTSREQSSMMRSVSYAKLFDELDRLQFEDYLGNKQSVFFSMDEKNTELKKFSDAPPLPPSGCFDVRYQSQRIAEVFSTSEKYRDFTIMITDATYPMKVRWNIKLDKGHQFILYDAPNGKRIHHTLSAETGDVIISDKSVNRIVLRIAQIPTQFVMLQNYPNPFNPITKIEYALPTDSKVSIKIFNLLGQEVKTLIEEEQDAGYKICEFDASEFTSGVYFYRVTAQSVGKTYSDVKKMLLLK